MLFYFTYVGPNALAIGECRGEDGGHHRARGPGTGHHQQLPVYPGMCIGLHVEGCREDTREPLFAFFVCMK